MPTSLGEHVRRLLGRETALIGRPVSVRHERNGANWPSICLHQKPTRHVSRWFDAHLATEQLPELGLRVTARDSVGHTLALAAPVKSHHQARLLPCAAP